MEKTIGNKISYWEENDNLYITITGRIEKWMENLIVIWTVAWTACGIIVLTQLFGDYTREVKLSFVVYLCFWIYFEYKVIRTLLWRKFGNERILIDDDTIKIKKEMRGYGTAYNYYIENITRLAVIDYSGRNFSKAYGKSFWIVGGETLSFDHKGKVISFAMQLEDEDRDALFRLIRSRFKEARKQLRK